MTTPTPKTPAPSNDVPSDGARERAWVLLPLEARARGFKSRLSFRRWLRRRGVPIRRDGRLEWVSPADVDAAVASMPKAASHAASSRASENNGTSVVDPVASAVATLMLRRRAR